LGTEYDAPSGALGLSADGSKTEGVLDVYPRPPQAATWLDITFYGAGDPESTNRPQFILRVNLPLPVLTTAEMAQRTHTTEAALLATMARLRRMRREAEERS
jgi:hypothetical protein